MRFSVRAYVCDGTSPNRKFFKLIAAGSYDDFYWAWNPVEKRKKIYMISDAPHLLKTTRNCLENSCWNKKTRNLHVSDQNFKILILYFLDFKYPDHIFHPGHIVARLLLPCHHASKLENVTS